MQMGEGRWYKVTGVVTNRDLPGDELIRWYRQRCGKGEEAHSVLKGGPCGGQAAVGEVRVERRVVGHRGVGVQSELGDERLVLGGEWVSRRLKAVRFGIINLAGRVVRHARKLIIRLARGHPSYDLLVSARQRIAALAKRTAQSLTYSNNPPTLEVTQPKSQAALCPTSAKIVCRTDLEPS